LKLDIDSLWVSFIISDSNLNTVKVMSHVRRYTNLNTAKVCAVFVVKGGMKFEHQLIVHYIINSLM